MEQEMKEALKQVSLKHAEIFGKDAVEYVYELITVAAGKSENKIDDMFIPVLNSLKPVILSYVDKIDGEAA